MASSSTADKGKKKMTTTTRAPPVTPQKRPRGGLVSTPTTGDPLASPEPTRPRKAPRPVETPSKRDTSHSRESPPPSAKAKDTNEPFVPRALHALIDYRREGESDRERLSPEKRAVFDFVVASCDVPSDFEANHKYGPKSGVCHEERLIAAYAFGQLACKTDRDERRRLKLRKFITSRRWTKAAHFVSEESMQP